MHLARRDYQRISEHIDLLIYDLGEPLRADLSSLAHVLSAARRQRIQRLFSSLLGTSVDHGLPVTLENLVRRSKPVIAVQQLFNWIDAETHQIQEEKLAELRSELPRRWLEGLHRVVQEESHEFESSKDNARTRTARTA